MFEQPFRSIDNVLWKEAGCATEMDYTEQTFWMLFLKYLDDLEFERSQEAELSGHSYEFRLTEDSFSSNTITASRIFYALFFTTMWSVVLVSWTRTNCRS